MTQNKSFKWVILGLLVVVGAVLLVVALFAKSEPEYVAVPTETPFHTPAPFTPTPVPTPTPTPTPERDFLYEGQVNADALIVRSGDGSDTGQLLLEGDYVTVVEKQNDLDGVTVPRPWGGQWCLVEPRDRDEWVACELLTCTRYCD